MIPPDHGDNATDQVDRLIVLLAKLPGMGRRSARRAALKLLRDPAGLMLPLADAMRSTAEAVTPCRVCGNLDTRNPCRICTDPNRDQEMVCVVEGVADLWALERARVHRGLYHVLGGVLSALSGVGPEDLAVDALLSRVAGGGIHEVILALPATVDGATTAHYLHDRLRSSNVSVTRLAQGVPMGGALDVMDDGTLAAALKARRPA
ncbi:recombination mediator RecR [Roseomonas haemaphysalidis]|uniref:Recombination protein RecR n=1 Tax=Roseomonas haemaphysalidis TaxID=2768162 RepID=A0ABS3KT45_9PROT|nr:recombination mediator RecR [Roseomonas haemaphysalidis]MBO1080120.1 recombination protein RecR [Roseomonas haemaphysalidis]